MADKKKDMSFKEFRKEQSVDEEFINYTKTPHVENPTVEVSDDKIPVLFATIHFKSDDRPNGYTDDDLFRMNYHSNAHLPELQKEMLAQRKADGHDVSEYEK